MQAGKHDRASRTPPLRGRRRMFHRIGLAALRGLLAAGVGALISARYGMEAFTAAKPLSLASAQMSAAEERELEEKPADFSSSFRPGGGRDSGIGRAGDQHDVEGARQLAGPHRDDD